MRAPPVIAAALALLLGGCVVHEARVDCPPAGPDDQGRVWIGGAKSQDIATTPPPSLVDRGQKPRDLPTTYYAMRRDDTGALLRWDGRVRTPLPWWQRFPADLATDFWPAEVVARNEVLIEPRVVPARTAADLAAEARAHGYAR